MYVTSSKSTNTCMGRIHTHHKAVVASERGEGGGREGPLTLSVTFVSLTKRPEANMAKCQHLMQLAGRYIVYVFYYLNFSDV